MIILLIVLTLIISVVLTLLVCLLIFKKWSKKTIPLNKDILRKIFQMSGSPKSEKDLSRIMYRLKKRD